MQMWESLNRLESWLMKCCKEIIFIFVDGNDIMVRSWPIEASEFYRMRLRHWNSKLSPASDSWIYNMEWIGFRCGGLECLSAMYVNCRECRGD